VGRRETDVAKTLRPVYGATIASLLLFCLVGPRVAPAQIFAGEAETNPKGKPPTKADFVLTVKDNLISLKAKDASLKEVLEEIGRKMKIDVVAGIPDTKKITAEFENLSIEEAVNRLSTNYSYVMDSTNGKRKITKIIVLEKGKETELSTPTTKESTIKKEEKSAKPESTVREEAVRKEAPPPTKQN
jgi:type II secretory pathway component GspD/PulD (secretin)